MALSRVFKPRRRRIAIGLAALLLWSVGWTVQADPTSPKAADKTIGILVTKQLPKIHLSRHPLDDEMAQRCLKMFVKALDPMKLYFYQSDIDGFHRQPKEFDAAVEHGDLKYAFEIFHVFLQRVDERVKLVDELLAAPQDFSVDEEMVVDRDSLEYPKDPAEARERWRKRIKYELLVLKTAEKEKLEGAKAVEKLERRYHSFAKRMHQTDSDELLEMYLSSLTTSYDPHTTYMAKSSLENFQIMMSLGLEGIGAALKSEDGYTIIDKIIPGGAADKEGHLKAGDRIVGVGQGHQGETEDVVDMKLKDVVEKIRGKQGSIVRLTYTSAGSEERKTIAITRAKIELKDSEARGQVFDAGKVEPKDSETRGQVFGAGKKADGSPYRVGVIDLPSFYMDMEAAHNGAPDYKSTTRDVRQILERFTAEHVDAVILDLRKNGGGSLQEAISLTGLFIDTGPVVQVKDANGRVQSYPDTDPGMAWNGPLVVLISKFSASASEILAGAIQDYGRGLIVGDHATHGKGTVQTLMDLGEQLFVGLPNPPKLGALKITMQQFYRPNGDSTQNRGVLSDIELPQLTSHLDVGEKDLDYPVAFDRVPAKEFTKYHLNAEPILDRLRPLSAQRCQASSGFQKELKDIARYNEQKERKTVTLNETKFMAERTEMNADKEEQKKIEELAEGNTLEIKRDYYLDEALAITSDYLDALRSNAATQAAQTNHAVQVPN